MNAAVLEEYVGSLADPRAEPVVRELDRIIRATGPDLDLAIKYRILMYAIKGDFHTWVCSINAGRRHVALHFLYGVLLSDPRKVLRPGSSVLMTWDIAFDQEVEEEAVTAYIAEAVARNAEYLADRAGILERSRAEADKGGRRRPKA